MNEYKDELQDILSRTNNGRALQLILIFAKTLLEKEKDASTTNADAPKKQEYTQIPLEL